MGQEYSQSELERMGLKRAALRVLQKGGPMPVFDEIPEESREEVEERAAIMEYEGGMSRVEAEEKAVDDFKSRGNVKTNYMQGMKI